MQYKRWKVKVFYSLFRLQLIRLRRLVDVWINTFRHIDCWSVKMVIVDHRLPPPPSLSPFHQSYKFLIVNVSKPIDMTTNYHTSTLRMKGNDTNGVRDRERENEMSGTVWLTLLLSKRVVCSLFFHCFISPINLHQKQHTNDRFKYCCK